VGRFEPCYVSTFVTNTIPSSVTSAGTVIVEIGPDRTKHVVHKALLIQHFEYFQKALQGQRKEAREGIVVLEDIESTVCEYRVVSHRAFAVEILNSEIVCIVNFFVHWLYTQSLPAPNDHVGWNSACGNLTSDHGELKIKTYAIADRFQAPVFHRAINKNFVDDVIRGGSWVEIYDILPLAEVVFEIISAD
jgi:hypothetical protein